ncbi:hypothetical protein F0562_007177 [Nyssa sinensis]|uniref:ADP-ribosylation factor GTPase-activating protein AGD14 n=1 Tax=Nyssa sinensis TaxID=561372 RepID=A0A5J5A663_9ASTE|nr:hypothetical protein F0562_007177 [Nyssa sinensis]
MAPALPSSSGDSMVSAAQQLPTVQQNQTSTFPAGGCGCTAQETTPSVGALDNQPWTSLLASNTQRPSNASAEQFSQAASKLARDTSSGAGSQALLAVDMKSNGRKELPADLFTASYLSFPAAVPSWQMRPPHGMQYHPTAMPVPTFPNSAKSTNPFDLSDDSTQVQAPMFPSMPQSLPYPSVVPPQSPSFEMSMSPRAFTGQQLLNNMPLSRPQGIGGFSGSEAAFGSLNTSQQSNGTYTAPATPLGGNPFG